MTLPAPPPDLARQIGDPHATPTVGELERARVSRMAQAAEWARGRTLTGTVRQGISWWIEQGGEPPWQQTTVGYEGKRAYPPHG